MHSVGGGELLVGAVVVVAVCGEVSLDCCCDVGEAAVALHFRNRLSASSIPAAVHRRRISPEPQFFTLRLMARKLEIIDSIGLVDRSVSISLPLIPSRVTVSVSSIPCLSDAAAPG